MLRTLVQEHSLGYLYLGHNKFTVDTIPEIVGTMTELKALGLNELGYTGKSGTPPVMSRSNNQDPFLAHTHFVTGEIPSSLGKLEELEGLFLVNNKISGELNIFGTSPS
jgi:hypothetical protein